MEEEVRGGMLLVVEALVMTHFSSSFVLFLSSFSPDTGGDWRRFIEVWHWGKLVGPVLSLL